MRRGGRVVYYGRARQARFDGLRSSGFTLAESRELSRISHPDDLKILRNMVAGRQTYVRQFKAAALRRGWTAEQRRYYYYAGLREKYRKAGFLGKPNPPMALWHMYENRMAQRRGWRKGTYDPENPEEKRTRRRRKSKTPPRPGAGRGQVRAQRTRAKLRGRAFRDHVVRSEGGVSRKVPLARLEMWLRDSEAMTRKTPVLEEWQRGLRRRISRAKTERTAGRDAVA